MNLKIGGNNVGKIMFNGQEFGNRKLEPGTILYMSKTPESDIKNLHLPSATKNWSNLNGIKIELFDRYVELNYGSIDISSDDFKNLDTEKKYTIGSNEITVSRSIVDGEYRLNININSNYKFMVKAI